MPELQPRQAPPPDYYAERLQSLLAAVVEEYADLLPPALGDFEQRLRSLPDGARRLYARLVTRKGPWFRADQLCYAEVPDTGLALTALAASGLIECNPEAPADVLLGLLRRAELDALSPLPNGATRRLKKPELIALLVGRLPDSALRQRLARSLRWLGLRHRPELRLAQLLFFGDPYQDLSAFVLEDLGLRRYESVPRAGRRFTDADELQEYLAMRRLERLCRRLDELPALAPGIAQQAWSAPAGRHQRRLRDRVLNTLGRWHERRGELDAALGCYGRATAAPARERQVRIWRRLGAQDCAAQLLDAMAREPWATEEWEFAEQQRDPGHRWTPPQTRVQLTAPAPNPIEPLALAQLTRDGGTGWHVENHLPLGLAGLLYWPVVFAQVPGAFTNPFQRGPLDLFWPDFAATRKGLIDTLESELAAPGALRQRLLQTCREKQGIANQLVHWGLWRPDFVNSLCGALPESALAGLAGYVIRQLAWARTGFPDLFVVYGPGHYEFVEVKGPTDQLQRVQRAWFRRLEELALPARVLRYRIAPC